jgi:Arc/MetJ family transcription regulator
MAKVMSRAWRRPSWGMPSAHDEHPRAAGVGPAIDTVFEEEPVDDQLAPTRLWRPYILIDASKTSVDVDRDIAAQAAAILGTDTLRDTINASLREVVDAKRRLELIALLSDPERYDFEAADAAWGADE